MCVYDRNINEHSPIQTIDKASNYVSFWRAFWISNHMQFTWH